MRNPVQKVLPAALALACLGCFGAWADGDVPAAVELRVDFVTPEAHQGVAVDEDYAYAINNTAITKHDKHTGEKLLRWDASEEIPLIHLNSGMVKDGKLYCAHSNYPKQPMVSSMEIWDTATLTHIGSHSFGITDGSLTWMDWHDGHWWGCFAQYDGRRGLPDRDHRWTRLVKYDEAWRPLEAWAFPDTVLEYFAPFSSSGGAWGPDGLLYVSGHDRYELYGLEVPRGGGVLVHRNTLPSIQAGQAIAFDRSGTGLLYGIVRRDKRIVACRWQYLAPPAPQAE